MMYGRHEAYDAALVNNLRREIVGKDAVIKELHEWIAELDVQAAKHRCESLQARAREAELTQQVDYLKQKLVSLQAVTLENREEVVHSLPMEPIIKAIVPSVDQLKTSMHNLLGVCMVIQARLNPGGGGRQGGAGGGGGRGRDTTSLDNELRSIVMHALQRIKQMGADLQRFEMVSLPLQARFVSDLYVSNQVRLDPNLTPPPHPRIQHLLQILFMIVRQSRHEESATWTSKGFKGFMDGFNHDGWGEGTRRGFDTAVRKRFNASVVDGALPPECSGLLQVLETTGDNYAHVRMLKSVMQQVYFLHITHQPSAEPLGNTFKRILHQGGGGGALTALSKTQRRWCALTEVMSLLGFGDNVCGPTSNMSADLATFFSDALAVVLLEGAPSTAYMHRRHPSRVRATFLEEVRTLTEEASYLPAASYGVLWASSGMSIANILHATMHEAVNGPFYSGHAHWEVTWDLGQPVMCRPVRRINAGGMQEDDGHFTHEFCVWGLAGPVNTTCMGGRVEVNKGACLLPRGRVLPRLVRVGLPSLTDHEGASVYGDMIVIAHTGVAVPLVQVLLAMGFQIRQELHPGLMLKCAQQRSRRSQRSLPENEPEALTILETFQKIEDRVLRAVFVGTERGLTRTRTIDMHGRGTYIQEKRDEFRRRHGVSIPPHPGYSSPWLDWMVQVKSLFNLRHIRDRTQFEITSEP